jgi:signal transduction histidine kinase/ligand-binding sensor domain-containing protein
MVKGMRRILSIGLFLCCWVKVSFSQDHLYSCRNYSAADGLPQSQITGILEDPNGYLWMGTEGGGLARFDGREFKVYTVRKGLLANEIMDIYQDKKQNIWVLHQHGVTQFNGVQFKTWQAPDSLNGLGFVKIFPLGDSIFLVTKGGLRAKIYNDSVVYWRRPLLKGKKIWWVHPAPGGKVVYGLDNGKILFQSESKIDSLSATSGNGLLYNIFNFNEHVLGRSEKGIFRFDFTHNRFEKMPWNTKGHVVAFDHRRNIFWTTDGNNLFKESFANEQITSCDTVMKDILVNQVLFDAEGNTWIGTSGQGLFRYYLQDFTRITPKNIRGVMSLLTDDRNNFWMGSMDRGFWRMKDKKIQTYHDKKIGRNSVNSIVQDKNGMVWFASRGGLAKYDPREDKFHWYTSEDGLPTNFILALQTDDKGGLWIATGHGICYYDGKTFKRLTEKDGMPANVACWSLHYSKKYKTLFTGTDMNLIAIHDNKVNVITIPRLKNAVITSIHAFADSLLAISTGGMGVIVFNPQTNKSFFISSQDGLASDFAYFVAPDDKDFLWVGTERGINRIKLNSKNEVVQNLHYGYDNGLEGVETNQNAFEFKGKEKYFGLVDGVYSFNSQQNSTAKSFDLHLTDVQILYGEYSSRTYGDSLKGFFKIPVGLMLPPDKNHVTFHFNRVDKQRPNSVRYKYYLENFDKAWSPPSSMKQVTYGNLPPGDYIFRVMATNTSGSWSDKEIAYAFVVRSPFYLRASFIIGMFILLAGITTLVLYLRVKQRIRKAVMTERIRLQEQEMLRKEIARDFHDEMGNQLTRIINYVSLLKLNGSNDNGHSHNHNELYTKVEESAKYLYNGTRDFIWSIDPVNDELNKLFIHIRDFGEKLFEEKNISFRAFNVINETKEKVKLPYGFSREANLIFKEAMTNAFKYSQARNVTFSLHQYDGYYEMILEDDGIGFHPGNVENSNGLKNIRERADRVGAILRISSNSGQGTKITLNFNLTKKINYGVTF